MLKLGSHTGVAGPTVHAEVCRTRSQGQAAAGPVESVGLSHEAMDQLLKGNGCQKKCRCEHSPLYFFYKQYQRHAILYMYFPHAIL
jgi:hypothetical protein